MSNDEKHSTAGSTQADLYLSTTASSAIFSMSHFNEIARNPATGIVEMAYWIDNHFGPHRYGVRFLDGTVWRPEEVDIRIGDRVVRDGEEAKKTC